MTQEILLNITPYEVRAAFVADSILQEIHIERRLYQGLLGNTGVPSVSMPTTKTAFSQLSADDVIGLPYQLKDTIKNRVFVMHRSILSLVRQLKDTSGRYLFNNYYPLATNLTYTQLLHLRYRYIRLFSFAPLDVRQ